MRILAKRAIALPVAAVSAVALSAVVANTAAADVTSGSVSLTVNASFLATLAKHGIGFAPQSYTSISYADGAVTVAFAATGGDADINSFSGTISYTGGIIGFDLKSGEVVNLDTLVFDLGNDAFDGQSSTSGGQVQLLDLAGSQYGNISGSDEAYSSTDLVLDPAGAAYLDSALDTTAFSSGEDVGSFTASWVV